METITIRSIGKGTAAPMGGTDPDYVRLSFEADTDKGTREIQFTVAAFNKLVTLVKDKLANP
jgi:hypothetical protein